MDIEVWTSPREDGSPSPAKRLFNRFDGMYPGLWSKNFATPAAVENWCEVWAEAFCEERITYDEVMTGLRACRKSHQFPPTLPQFLQLCREPIDYDKAFYEAVIQMGVRRRPNVELIDGQIVQQYGKDVWTNPAIYWAAVAMGRDLDLQYKEIRSRWHYELDRVLSGEVRPVPQNANLIESKPPSKELSPEEISNVENIFKNLHSMFEQKPVVERPDIHAKAALEQAKQLLAKK
jgi:hypothetical protein